MFGHTDLLAHSEDGASAASRTCKRAEVFAEGNEEAVDRDPVFAGQLRFQGGQCLFQRLGPHIAPAVGDAMDMRIHSDTWLSAGDAERQVRALGADATERKDDFLLARA